MLVQRTENNQWMRANRVIQGMRTLREDVDSAWPRDTKGNIDWSR
jgi:hypothetical protein